MCVLCQAGASEDDLARRRRVLQLLALVEHPDALPAEAALRLGREVVALIGGAPGPRRCEAVAAQEPR